MPAISCALEGISKVAGCNRRGGIRALYWTEYQNIDWDTMVADPLQFDPANHEILEYTMIGGATWAKVEFEKKESFYEFTYSDENDYYELLVTIGMTGKSSARRLALQKAIQCCEIVAHIFGYSGEQRVIGLDYNGEVIESIVDLAHIGRHADRGGQLGTSRAGDDFDIVGEAFYAPLFAQAVEGDLPLV